MAITLTPAQAAALARIAAEHDSQLQLHQVGEDPDVLVTTSGPGQPDLLLRPDGAVEPVKVRQR